MPLLLKSNRLSGLRPVFTDNLENYKRFIQIRKKFEENNMYRLFSEPKLDQIRQESEWYTDWEGKVFTFDAFLQANPQVHQEELESSIRAEVNKLFSESEKYKDTDPEYRALNDTLLQCIEVPGNNDIHIVILPSGEQKYVLTNWGFITDAFNAQTGIIQKMRVLSLFNLRLCVKYTNGAPAANEKIYTEYDGKREEIITDANGEYVIARFPAQTSLMIYQIDASGQKANTFSLPVVDADVLNLTFKNLHVADHTFVIQDENGKNLSGLGLLFRVNNADTRHVSGSDGKIQISEIPDQAAVESYFEKDGKSHLIDSFRSNLTQTEHIVRVPAAFLAGPIATPPITPPEPLGDITLHFIDKKRVDVGLLPVNLSFPDGHSEQHTTGEDGRFTIPAPPPGTKIGLAANKDKIRWTGKFKTDDKSNYYVFIFKKKSRWWLWLILGLLLLGLLLLAGYLIYGCVRNNPIVNDMPVGQEKAAIRVIDDKDETPISDATVKLTYMGHSIDLKTDQNGIIAFDNIPTPVGNAPLVIYVTKTGYGDERREITELQDEVLIRMKKLTEGGMEGKRGALNVNLKWDTEDDLDLVVIDPCGNQIYFNNKSGDCKSTKGELDVDANADFTTSTPQENIYWETAGPGEYKIGVVFYKKRAKRNVPYKITIMKGNQKDEMNLNIDYTGDKVIKMIKTIQL